MANIHGIEVSGETYDLEDTNARNGVSSNAVNIGDLSDLETTAKTDLVSAVNEVATKDPSTGLTCGYYQVQIPADDAIHLSNVKMGTLIGKRLSELAVGQGVLLQGFTKRTNATEYLPFSIFLQKTESGFSSSEAIADTDISTNLFPSSGNIYVVNEVDSAVTLFLNVVGINAFIIEN